MPPDVTVTVDPDATSDWTVSPLVFGKFQEHLRGAVYPGVYEDYLKNGSFEVWNESATGPMNGLVYPEVGASEGVAYPWEPVGGAGFEHVEGGVHGRRRDPDLDGGPGVPGEFHPEPAGVAGPRFQRVSLDGRGGVEQRVALPDDRVTSFDAAITVRGEGVGACRVALAAPDGEVLAAAEAPVTGEWERREVALDLDATSPDRYRGSRYGEYVLSVTAAGDGRLDLDRSTLIPADAVEGIYNPTTLELLREFDVTTIRWPGGNYASQVRWRDTVGPVEDRPVVPIVNWGGLEPNYLGTNEWLRFCELAGVEPYITVPFWSATGPGAAGDWVEYVNGDPGETELGALRAEHGHEEPWDVTYWGIGNEVWGHWQVGNTDAASYAEGYREYRDAMLGADPDIEIDASGIDPWFTDVHDGSYDDVRRGEEPVWNEVLLEAAGPTVEGLDLHRYTVGLRDGDGAREAWLEDHGEDPVGYNEVLVNFPAVYDRLLSGVEGLAADHGAPDVRLTIGEWNLGPATNDDWPSADTGTMAHAAYAARTFQTFIRHGEHVRLGHWTDYTLYPHPRPDGIDPPHPGAYIQREMAAPILGGDCRVADTAVESPERPFYPTGTWSRPAEDIPLVGAATVVDAAGAVHTFVTNGSLREAFETAVAYGDGAGAEVTLYRPVDGDPFREQESWEEPDAFEVEEFVAGDGRFELPPASFAALRRRP